MIEEIIGFACCLLCAFPLFIFGYFNNDSREPVVFWARDTSPLEKVKDIKGYNEAIRKLYLYCAFTFAIIGLVFFFHVIVAYVCIGLVCTLGIYLVWRIYKSILAKYS